MRKREHILAWANHAALNAGSIVECFVHIIVPPQFDHTPEVVESLSQSTPWVEFARGTGFVRPPDEGEVAPRYSKRWWASSVVHNCIVHPCLPFADFIDLAPSSRVRSVAAFLYRAHDATAPVGAG